MFHYLAGAVLFLLIYIVSSVELAERAPMRLLVPLCYCSYGHGSGYPLVVLRDRVLEYRLHLPDCEDIVDMVPLVGDVEVDVEKLPNDPLGCRWKKLVIRKDNPVRALILYRDQLDQQTDDQMTWQPYTPERLALLPDICLRDKDVWQTIAPLICFDVIEWHRPDRVLRQYSLRQGIPMNCDTEAKLHAIDKRGRNHYEWHIYHRRYIQLWEARKDTIASGEPEERPMHYHDQYMKWYRRITRCMITTLTQRPHMGFQPSSGTTHLLVQSLTAIYNQCTKTLGTYKSESGKQALTDIQTMCTQVLQIIGENRHLEEKPSPTLATSSSSLAQSSTIHVELPLQHNHEELAPPQATSAAAVKEISTGGRGRGKSRNRESSMSRTIGSCISPPVAAAQPTAPPNIGSMERQALDQSQVKAVPSAEPVQQLDGEEGSSQAIQKESSHVTRPKKKKSPSISNWKV